MNYKEAFAFVTTLHIVGCWAFDFSLAGSAVVSLGMLTLYAPALVNYIESEDRKWFRKKSNQ